MTWIAVPGVPSPVQSGAANRPPDDGYSLLSGPPPGKKKGNVGGGGGGGGNPAYNPTTLEWMQPAYMPSRQLFRPARRSDTNTDPNLLAIVVAGAAVLPSWHQPLAPLPWRYSRPVTPWRQDYTDPTPAFFASDPSAYDPTGMSWPQPVQEARFRRPLPDATMATTAPPTLTVPIDDPSLHPSWHAQLERVLRRATRPVTVAPSYWDPSVSTGSLGPAAPVGPEMLAWDYRLNGLPPNLGRDNLFLTIVVAGGAPPPPPPISGTGVWVTEQDALYPAAHRPAHRLYRPFRPEAVTVDGRDELPNYLTVQVWQWLPQQPRPGAWRPFRPFAVTAAVVLPITEEERLQAWSVGQQIPIRRTAARPVGGEVETLILSGTLDIAALGTWNVPGQLPRLLHRPFRPDAKTVAPVDQPDQPLTYYNAGAHVPPQRPVILPRLPRLGEVAEDRFFASLGSDNLVVWAVPGQSPYPRAERQEPASGSVAPVQPIPDFALTTWVVPWQSPHPRAERIGPNEIPSDFAPPVFGSGVSIIVTGPYWVVAAQIYVPGAVAGDVLTE